MNAAAYNEKLLFVADKGDLSIGGSLYRKYCSAFDEWYGEPISEDSVSESGYPENDFREWFTSRITDSNDEIGRWNPEISDVHLDEEIERIREAKKILLEFDPFIILRRLNCIQHFGDRPSNV